ncbi:hypothetical protein FH063_002336 [Azospirillum argentinense]|uniref:Uncharacterized protein n=1 Tax=Azospirillum argentinense TaxID=2970906 RepID=A0A5B0KSI3_9PROT|nr:hypothetical protein FH063_002336 [Azospirillum argentinense]
MLSSTMGSSSRTLGMPPMLPTGTVIRPAVAMVHNPLLAVVALAVSLDHIPDMAPGRVTSFAG